MIEEVNNTLESVLIEQRKKDAEYAKKSRRKVWIKKHIFIWSLLGFPIISWLIFYLYANFNMILMAFQTNTGAWSFINFVSFWNDLTAPHSSILICVKNTFLYFGLNNLVLLPLGTIVSYFLYKKIVGYKAFRVLFFLPSIIPGIVLVTLFKEIIKPWGPLATLGIVFPETGLLANADTATLTIMGYCLWTGFATGMLLMTGAMTRIPIEVLEAARLDGCGPFREFISLVIPLIMPTLSMNIIFSLTGLFGSSGPILLMTGGAYETSTLSYWIFENVYRGTEASGAYNRVSATGLVFTCISMPLILFVKWLTERIDQVEY